MTTGGQLWLTNGNATGRPCEGGVSAPDPQPSTRFDLARTAAAPGRRLGDSGRHRRAAARWALIRAGAARGQRQFIRKALPAVLVVGPAWQ